MNSHKSIIEVFCSYAHNDEEMKDRLLAHLSLMKREGIIDIWHDRMITVGQEWEGRINEHLNAARVILLLVSADFIASDYCYDIEMRYAMQRHDSHDARVIPIILRPVDWVSAPFGRLQALPKDGLPITSWGNQDAAFANVATGIRKAVLYQSVEGLEEYEKRYFEHEGHHLNYYDTEYHSEYSSFISSWPKSREWPYYRYMRSWDCGQGINVLAPSTENDMVVIDDVIVEYGKEDHLTLLDVRVRNAGKSVANLTRANIRIFERYDHPTMGVYKPSASYDIRISQDDNEVAIAHKLEPGEIDRFILRVEENHDVSYLARLEILYNKELVAKSDIFRF